MMKIIHGHEIRIVRTNRSYCADRTAIKSSTYDGRNCVDGDETAFLLVDCNSFFFPHIVIHCIFCLIYILEKKMSHRYCNIIADESSRA